MITSVSTETENVKCQTCVSLFSEAKLATVHLGGTLGEDVYLCAEHFLERYPNYRVPMTLPPAQEARCPHGMPLGSCMMPGCNKFGYISNRDDDASE